MKIECPNCKCVLYFDSLEPGDVEVIDPFGPELRAKAIAAKAEMEASK